MQDPSPPVLAGGAIRTRQDGWVHLHDCLHYNIPVYVHTLHSVAWLMNRDGHCVFVLAPWDWPIEWVSLQIPWCKRTELAASWANKRLLVWEVSFNICTKSRFFKLCKSAKNSDAKLFHVPEGVIMAPCKTLLLLFWLGVLFGRGKTGEFICMIACITISQCTFTHCIVWPG